MAVVELGGDLIESFQIERLIGVIVDTQVDIRLRRVRAPRPRPAEHNGLDALDAFHPLDELIEKSLALHKRQMLHRPPARGGL